MRVKSLILTAALVGVVSGAPAQAETFATGFGGTSFGGDTSSNQGTLGLGLGWLGGGVFGFEVMFHHTPDFFGDNDFLGSNNVSTLMGNLMLSAPIDRTRIYASGGAGLMRSRVDDADDFFDVNRDDFGVNVGGGVLGYLSENVGLRGDVRYFRNVGDPEPDAEFDIDFGSFSYWQATAGLAVRF